MTHTSPIATKDNNRAAGVLLHPTSLPGPYGIGDLGDELLAFLDWAKKAGIHIWQVLPLNVPGYGNSPYGCLSSYAGNPLLISPQRLLEGGLLPSNAIEEIPGSGKIDFASVAASKDDLLRRSFAHFNEHALEQQRESLISFVSDNTWLPDWALYASLKQRHGG
ncbi:MAG TPA: 4-alpha-glucanotransferase, partial [Thermoanaerobaculia bacterium]|nr:4-alpha-glucanotransferase [Thermoanaerobaculia bacterium]